MERIELQAGYSISRVIKGGWHLAGGHGKIDEQAAIEDMLSFVKAGITTFDCADIYTGVEILIGKFLSAYKPEFTKGELPNVQIHTKYVPDLDKLSTLKQEDTSQIIERSLTRLGVEQLDLVQFAWWDYDFPNYVDTALHLVELQKQGKIRRIGVTNFSNARIKELVDAGVSIAANQVQYSVMDQRPFRDLPEVAKKYNIPFLCYGSIAGGFLSNRYLNVPDPSQPLENRSLTKYRLIIEEFGGYDFFQETLRTLNEIANNHEVGIAEIASKYVLQKPMVGGVIIGARNRNHLTQLQRLSDFTLSESDVQKIDALAAQSTGPKGPVYDLEREKGGTHAAIMRYNLNEQLEE